ncbi:hypothetical protein ACF1BN_34875 [Streptomyces sp. NPDC014861]|uniref:hypothetical protein n=1 Tax=Streptomyces sp. NPDC014861 TaxID=3364923 RepID=UPI0036FDE2F0
MTRFRGWKAFVLGRLGRPDRGRSARERRTPGGEGRPDTGTRDWSAYLPGPDGAAMTRDRAGEERPRSSGSAG